METPDALAALEREWSELAFTHGDGIPFRTWEWNHAWWRWYQEQTLGVRDSLFFRAVRDGHRRLVGVAPLILVRRPGYGPVVSRGLEFVGADPYVTEIRGVLAAADQLVPVHRALVAHLNGYAGQWDWVRWRGLPGAVDGAPLEGAVGALRPLRETPAYHLDLPGSWEQFRSSRPRNLKESLRKCYNSLQRDGHRFELRVARTPDAVRPAVERFLLLHRARSEASGLLHHNDVFSDPASRGFLAEVCQRLAARDAVRVFQLRIGDQVVATRMAFAISGTLYLYFSGFDPAWARYSVMTTTLAEAFRYAIEHGFRRVHLSTGTDESKLRWRPDCTVYRDVEQHAGGVRAAGVRWIAETTSAACPPAMQRLARAVLGRRRQLE